jgi:hypothetical protein
MNNSEDLWAVFNALIRALASPDTTIKLRKELWQSAHDARLFTRMHYAAKITIYESRSAHRVKVGKSISLKKKKVSPVTKRKRRLK